MNPVYKALLEKAADKKEENEALLKRLENGPSLDKAFQAAHEKAFEKIDCLQCANCCKTTSPILYQNDMDRIAGHIALSTGAFIQKYVEMDEDGDFVFNRTPCPFLGKDNKCEVYEVRPEACRDYPHTNRKNMIDVLDIALVNSLICPAGSKILSDLKEQN